MDSELQAWEGEGGAALASPTHLPRLTGTPNQVEWAERIRRNVNVEFDRVAASFQSIAEKQTDGKRAATEAIITLLEEKRAEVMSQEQAGYFIHDWQEINDQVRKMIGRDPRYQEIRAKSKLN